jgi:hypothetical protein
VLLPALDESETVDEARLNRTLGTSHEEDSREVEMELAETSLCFLCLHLRG